MLLGLEEGGGVQLVKKEKRVLWIGLFAAALVLFVVFLGAKPRHERALETIGAGKLKEYAWSGVDTHGGFFGDGASYFRFDLSAAGQMEKVLQKAGWHELEVLDERVFDEVDAILSCLVLGGHMQKGERETLLAAVKDTRRGGWFFLDRQDEESPEKLNLDKTFGEERHSTNLVIAFYNADTGTICYFDSDT